MENVKADALTKMHEVELSKADLAQTDLALVTDLAGIKSGGITTDAKSLPSGFQLIGGFLVGPKADLTGADLSNEVLKGVSLQEANLTDAVADHTTVDATTDLTGATLAAAFLRLEGTPKLSPNAEVVADDAGNEVVIAPGTYPSQLGTKLEDVRIKHASLAGANLTEVDFGNAEFLGTPSSAINLSGAIVSGTNFNGAVFTNANLDGAVGASTWSMLNAILQAITCPNGTVVTNNAGHC